MTERREIFTGMVTERSEIGTEIMTEMRKGLLTLAIWEELST